MKHLLFLVVFVGLGFSLNVAKGIQLAKNPTIISLIYHEPAENFSASFGHINLRISYGAKPDMKKDVVFGYGPEVRAGSGVLEYLGIGTKLPLISWTESFEESYQNASREKMIGVLTLELRLSAAEREQIIEALNASLATKTPPTYNAIFRNCSSEVAKVIEDFSKIRAGILALHPRALERRMQKYAYAQQYYPSGRVLKTNVLNSYRSELRRIFKSENEQRVFEKQIMSAHSEFRILALQKVIGLGATSQFVSALFNTESPRRLVDIKKRLSSAGIAYEYSYPENSPTGVTSVKADANSVIVTYRVTGSGPVSKGAARSASAIKWKQKDLGMSNGAYALSDFVTLGSGSNKRTYIWLAKSLKIDPE